MRLIAIKGTAAFFPDKRRFIDGLDERAGLTPEEIAFSKSVGVETVAADDRYDAFDLAAEAARRVLAACFLVPDEVDVVISLQSRAPRYLISSDAARMQEVIGARSALSFSVGDVGCVSISVALLLAQKLLDADRSLRNVLITYGSKPVAGRRLMYPVSIIGDGGMAVVVGRSTRRKILALAVETNGRYSDLYRVDYRSSPEDQWKLECTDAEAYSFRLATESRNRFRSINERVLDEAGVPEENVRHWIMQNISVSAFAFYTQTLGVTFTRSCFENLRAYGHLGSMDVILNLHTALERGDLARGDAVVVMNNSPSAAWSTMVLEV